MVIIHLMFKKRHEFDDRMEINVDKVVFLDRDGTINTEKNYLYKIEDFEFIEGAEEGIKLLNENGYRVVVVTNQAGVARGYYSESDVEKLHAYINDRLKECGAFIDGFFYCPHHPEHGIGKYKLACKCRKPETGMFKKAEELYNIDKSNSYMVGDNVSDINAGINYGIKTILVSTGYGKKVMSEHLADYDYYKNNLLDACKFIVNN